MEQTLFVTPNLRFNIALPNDVSVVATFVSCSCPLI